MSSFSFSLRKLKTILTFRKASKGILEECLIFSAILDKILQVNKELESIITRIIHYSFLKTSFCLSDRWLCFAVLQNSYIMLRFFSVHLTSCHKTSLLTNSYMKKADRLRQAFWQISTVILDLKDQKTDPFLAWISFNPICLHQKFLDVDVALLAQFVDKTKIAGDHVNNSLLNHL